MAPTESLTTQRDLSIAYPPIGPTLLGLEKPLQIVQMSATVNDLVQIAAHDAMLSDLNFYELSSFI